MTSVIAFRVGPCCRVSPRTSTYVEIGEGGGHDEWRVAVEDTSAAAARVLDAMAAESGPAAEVVVAGGWLHNPMVRAVKVAQYGRFRTLDLAEPGAVGAARLAGLAAGFGPPVTGGG